MDIKKPIENLSFYVRISQKNIYECSQISIDFNERL